MTVKNKRPFSVRLLIMLLILAVAGFAAYRFMQIKKAGKTADEVLDVMYDLVPGLGVDSDVSIGRGKDPLMTLSINDIDVVGCLEIPSIELITPVTVESEQYEGFLYFVSGSPVKGHFMVEGDRASTLSTLSKAQPGDKVVFTDIEGIRYTYTVTTQFNLKDWDTADNDLMVCYRIDDKTRFVLGCTLAD